MRIYGEVKEVMGVLDLQSYQVNIGFSEITIVFSTKKTPNTILISLIKWVQVHDVKRIGYIWSRKPIQKHSPTVRYTPPWRNLFDLGLEHPCLKFQLNFIVCLTNNIIDGILGFIFCLGFPGNEGYGLHPGKNWGICSLRFIRM